MTFLIFCLCYGLINLWILWWFWRALQGTGTLQIGLCLAILLLALLFPLFYFYKMPGNTVLHTLCTRLGALWTGIFLYLFFMVLFSDLVWLVARIGKFSFTPTRPWVAAMMLGICSCIAVAGWINAANPVVREFDLVVKKDRFHRENSEERPFTIAAISDLHLGRILTAKRLENAVDLISPYKPDLVLFLGDILDDHFLLDLEAMKRAVAKLQPPLGVWGIAGNHEYYAGEIGKSIEILEACGIKILRDAWAFPDNSLVLVGRDDKSKQRLAGKPRKSLAAILKTIPAELKEKPVILMDHQPYHLEKAEAAGIMLELSGHTHNGQLWPFNYLVNKIYENPMGYLKKGETHYLVSTGAGTWGPPLRTNSRPDVLIVRIRGESP